MGNHLVFPVWKLPTAVLFQRPLPHIMNKMHLRCRHYHSSATNRCPQQKTLELPRTSYVVSSHASSRYEPPPKGRKYIYALCFALGIALGTIPNMVMVPVSPEKRGPTQNAVFAVRFFENGEALEIVRRLSSDSRWKSWDAYHGLTDEEKVHRLTTGPMGGVHTIGGFQRIFWNEESGEVICVVHIGSASWGWPYVAHGGLIATLMDENLGRCAATKLLDHKAVTANMELKYYRPVTWSPFNKNLYVIYCKLGEEGASARERWASATLETLEGVVCVEADGLYVSPKSLDVQSLSNGF